MDLSGIWLAARLEKPAWAKTKARNFRISFFYLTLMRQKETQQNHWQLSLRPWINRSNTPSALLSFQQLLERRFFCLVFYFKGKYFVLIDHIWSETKCFLCFCVLSSNIYTKIKLRPQIGLTHAISIVKWFFGFLSKKIFFTFLCWIWVTDVLQQYCENFRKIEQVKLVENLAPKLPTL